MVSGICKDGQDTAMKINTTTPYTEDENTDPFAEYLRAEEPERAYKAYAWQTAIGLQDVDKLTPEGNTSCTGKTGL